MISTKAIELIKHYEGLHDGDLTKIGLQPKLCPAGYWTVGYGHVVIDPKTNRPLKGAEGKARALQLYPALTLADAEILLTTDLNVFEAITRKEVRTYLNEEQIGALVSFSFNIGQGNFRSSDALALINRKQFEKGTDAFMNWKSIRTSDGTLKPLPGLIARRRSEQHLFLTGQFKKFN